tara:strand:+ start:1642 stop:2679 length:1038 start_codon:yes stop_codon:yes gene_type:complete
VWQVLRSSKNELFFNNSINIGFIFQMIDYANDLCIHNKMSFRFYHENIILDRAPHFRKDKMWLTSNLKNTNTRVIPVWQDKNLFQENNKETPSPIILSGATAQNICNEARDIVFLGLVQNNIYFAADINNCEDPYSMGLPKRSVFADLRLLATSIDYLEAGYLAYARALVYWGQNNQFCGQCGSKTKSINGGHERKCISETCSKSIFPRTDPAVIMLVTHPTDDKCLLGHNKKFKGLRFSTIAGFVEPGETLEQAVSREVFEETNIRVENVKYQASQPWPFPASIMLGFTAQATSTEIICHDGELEEARWFSRQEVLEMSNSDNMLPPPKLSISRWLIDTWLEKF